MAAKKAMTAKQNWFATLNDALNSEGLIEAWDCCKPPIGYGETVSWDWDDGSKRGRHISIYRDEQGRYERPVHYAR